MTPLIRRSHCYFAKAHVWMTVYSGTEDRTIDRTIDRPIYEAFLSTTVRLLATIELHVIYYCEQPLRVPQNCLCYRQPKSLMKP